LPRSFDFALGDTGKANARERLLPLCFVKRNIFFEKLVFKCLKKACVVIGALQKVFCPLDIYTLNRYIE
jgi:hypothetical protein